MRMNLLEALSDNIVVDKSKCVYCGTCVDTCILDNLRLKLAPCRQGCPMGTNVQGYVQETLRGNNGKALEIIRETLIFPEILGRVCPAHCESNCHREKVGDGAVSARAIKRYLTDGQTVEDIKIPEFDSETGKKAAIVGSGPAGLQAAYDLRLKGHDVVVFEADNKPGGAMRSLIPEFRLPEEVLDRELTLLIKMGVEFKCSTVIGQDISFDKLSSDYDSVILATGCTEAVKLGVKGENLDNVYSGLSVLKSAKTGDDLKFTGEVTVIGGGNVAVDAAQTALRLGADKVKLVCLEAENEMPASDHEIKSAEDAGIEILNCFGPTSIESDGKALKIKLQKCLGVFDAKGTFCPSFDSAITEEVKSDFVIVAIGQRRSTDLFDKFDTIDELTKQSGDSNVFIAGDFISGPSSVVEAMAGGRTAAESADRFMTGSHMKYGRTYQGPYETEFDIDTSAGSDDPKVELPMGKFGGKGDFDELEQKLSDDAAKKEAGRCYSCGQPFGKFRTCWFCLPCEVECPEDALWVEIPYLLR